jgi:hypothetical protein
MYRKWLIISYPFFWLIFRVRECARDLKYFVGVKRRGDHEVIVDTSQHGHIIEKLAVISVYYSHHRSNQVLIDALKERGYLVALVFNRTILLDEIQQNYSLVDVVIRRGNYAYDIGSYKAGLKYFKDRINSSTDLILANDSAYCWKKSSRLIFDVLESCSPFVGITENKRKRHLQAYLLRFTGGSGATDAAVRFFQKLHLRGSKNWAINKGELGLSSHMLSNNFSVCPVVNSGRMSASGKPQTITKTEAIKLSPMILGTQFPILTNTTDVSTLDSVLIGETYEKFSAHHYLGISLGIEFGVPFKLDLNEIYSGSEIANEISKHGLSAELSELVSWYGLRARRVVGSRGFERSFATRNLR